VNKLLFIFTLLISQSVLSQTKIDPISVAVKRIQTSKQFDAIEFQYVGSRCGALNNTMGAAFETMSDNKELAKKYYQDGNLFYDVGMYLGKKEKQSQAYQDNQYLMFVKVYTMDIKENIEKNNKISDFIWNEVKSCEVIKNEFLTIDKKLFPK
jgi:hypothetical protein